MSKKVIQAGTIFLGQSLNFVVNFLLAPYLARALSVYDNGTYGQVILIGTIAGGVLQLGFPHIIYLFYAKKGLDHREAFWSNCYPLIALGAIGAVALYFAAPVLADVFRNESSAIYLRIFCWSLIFSLPYLSLSATLVYFDRVRQSVLVAVLTNLLKAGGVFIGIQFFNSLPIVFVVLVVVAIVQFVLCFYFMPKHLLKSRSWNLQLTREQLLLGIPLGAGLILGILMNQTDKFMIGLLMDPEKFAIYRNGAIPIPFVNILFNSISMIVLPELARLYQEGKLEMITQLKNKVIRVSAALIYPIVLPVLFFSKSLIILYLSPKYALSVTVFTIFNIIAFFRVNSYRDVIITSGNTKFILKMGAFAFLANVPLNYWLIAKLGYYGPALSTLLVRLLLMTAFTMKTLQILGISIGQLIDFRKVFSALLISTLVTSFFVLIHYGVQDSRLVVLYVGLSASISYLWLLKKQVLEKELFFAVLDKFPLFGKQLKSCLKLN